MSLTPLISEPITSTKYLQFVRFRDLVEIWHSGSAISWKSYSEKYQLVKIGDILLRSKLTVDIQDATIYTRVTIKLYGKWVMIRDTEIGKNIGTKKQWLVKEWQLIISKIDARNGAFGVVPSQCEGAIATNDFPSFDVATDKITAEFLQLITSTEEFQNICESASTGTTGRRRVDMTKFLSMSIPLPDLATQSRIVREYQDRMGESVRLQQLANAGEKDIESYLIDALGITIENTEKKQGINFVRFRDLERWDIQTILSPNNYSYKHIAVLWDVARIFWGFAFPSSKFKKTWVPVIKIKNIFNGSVSLLSESFWGKDQLPWLERFLIQDWDMLIAMTGATIGKIGFFESNKQALLNQRVWKLELKLDKIIKKYLFYICDTNYFRQQIYKYSLGWAQPNISGSSIEKIKIPLPPLSIQSEIVTHIESIKSTIATARTESERLRNEARTSFERELFA